MALKTKAKVIAYNAAANGWPGWGDDGIVITQSHIEEAFDLAKGEKHARAMGLRHPFYDREVPIILGDHVSAEEGTGAVHTAPGHGVEDFVVGQKYGLVEKYPRLS